MKQLTPAVNSNDNIYGNPFAGVELVEYGDYECPYCGRAYPIVKDIKQQLGGHIKFIFRNFPLRKIHPHAFAASVATEAAALQGKFWEMHDTVFENQKTLDDEHILFFASQLGLDIERFKNDTQQKQLTDKVEKDFESGLRSGVNKTPTFFINGEKYEGEWWDGNFMQYAQSILTGMPKAY
jgi:protein-disulfide isomerase